MIILTLIFASIFMLLLTSLADYVLTQKKATTAIIDRERALQIAEAGIEYYRWHLAHFPDDFQDGTGGPGPYEHTYQDPESGAIGVFSLEIGGIAAACGKPPVIMATSTGWTLDNPSLKRTLAVRIGRPNVASYSYITDENVWVGDDRIITGPYHSNGGIRMDGDNHSIVTSKLDEWDCTSSYGCTPRDKHAPGVVGDGTHPELWYYPVPDINFTNFSFDFEEMKTTAQTSGRYFPKISNDDSDGTGIYGYHIVLKNNRTMDVYRVTKINWITSGLPSNSDVSLPELVGSLAGKQTLIGNYSIPNSCGIVYVEDRVWLDGVVSGKVTIVANDTGLNDPDLFLLNNITYATGSEVDGLLAVAERNLLIPLYVPDDMILNGIFFAQKGSYGRNAYTSVPSGYASYKERNSLTTNGTVVSKRRTGTKWSSSPPQGFLTRYDTYDRTLAENPPPLVPFTSPNFRYLRWGEVY